MTDIRIPLADPNEGVRGLDVIESIAQEMCSTAAAKHDSADGYAYEKLGKYGERILAALPKSGPEGLRAALEAIVNERDTELDMMNCPEAKGTPENAAWHHGVYEAWKRFEIVKQIARDALAPKSGPVSPPAQGDAVLIRAKVVSVDGNFCTVSTSSTDFSVVPLSALEVRESIK